jgi:serine protease
VAPVLIAVALSAVAAAGPVRGTPLRSGPIALVEGRSTDRLVIKLAEDRGFRFEHGQLLAPQASPILNSLLAGSTPLFSQPPALLRKSSRNGLADLTLYRVLNTPDAVSIGNRLLQLPGIETAYLAPTPVAPPADIPPVTSDFTADQLYDQPGPDGFGFDIAKTWPGGDGANVAIVDLEYGFDPEHEDLEDVEILALGPDHDSYQFHGNGVLGMLAAPDNGYGVTGLSPGSEFMVVSPFVDVDVYNVADAISVATTHMSAGDILLIEQQGWVEGTYTPVEIDPAVFDAIAAAVDAGIVVIEPAGNGACDLDDPVWGGAFDRSLRDSGAIMVGGGASPFSAFPARSYHPMGSCYGDRIDVQGWFDHIVALSAGDGAPSFTDLFFPDHDGRQAYTAMFGGTSGASPMVAAVAAVMNSVAIETRGEPWDPIELRAAMKSTGHPQAGDTGQWVGPQPDLRRMLRIYGVR